MHHKSILDGKQLGDWEVLYEVPCDPEANTKFRYYLCRCKCGTEKRFHVPYLNTGKLTCCEGCREKDREQEHQQVIQQMVGTSRGGYTIIGFSGFNSAGSRTWVCRCRCGKETIYSTGQLQGTSHNRMQCKNCQSEEMELSNRVTTFIPERFWRRLRDNAVLREITFSITQEQAYQVFANQGMCCALTGEPLWFSRLRTNYNRYTTASVDRIDSDGAYTIDNIQWVHKVVNQMKWSLPQKDFISWCSKIGRGAQVLPLAGNHPYEKALVLAKATGLRTPEAYRGWIAQVHPVGLPPDPDVVYKDSGWEGWEKFLGTWIRHSESGKRGIEFLPYEKAREMARASGAMNKSLYLEWAKTNRVTGIPHNPEHYYSRKGWVNWGDFLGTWVEKQGWLPVFPTYEEARKIVLGARIRTSMEYDRWNPISHGMPSSPSYTYKGKGWQGWGEFLATGNVSMSVKTFLPYGEARKVARAAGIQTVAAYRRWVKATHPEGMPYNPSLIYDSWTTWTEFLGAEVVAPQEKVFLPYEEAKKVARAAGIRGQAHYQEWFKKERPKMLPSSPDRIYKGKGWVNWKDFLGTVRVGKASVIVPAGSHG